MGPTTHKRRRTRPTRQGPKTKARWSTRRRRRSETLPAKAGMQSPGTRVQVWVPAFAGMTLTFPVHSRI